MSSLDDPDLEMALLILRSKWGEDPSEWLPCGMSIRNRDLGRWPDRLIKGLSRLAIRTHNDRDRIYIMERLRKGNYQAIDRVLASMSPMTMDEDGEADACGWDTERMLDELDTASKPIKVISKHWGENAELWLPKGALPNPSPFGWDIELLRAMASFAAKFPRVRDHMQEHFVKPVLQSSESKVIDLDSWSIAASNLEERVAHLRGNM